MRRALLAVVIAAAAFAVPVIPLVQPAGAASTKMISASVPHSCPPSGDQTGALQDFLGKGLGNGGVVGDTLVLQPDGCYILNEKVTLALPMTFDLNGAKITRTKQQVQDPNSSQGKHFGFINVKGNYTTIKNGTLEERSDAPPGYSAIHEVEHGIEFLGGCCHDIVVRDMKIDNVRGDCIYVQGTTYGLIKNITCIHPRRQGMGLVEGTRNVIVDNFDLTRGVRSGIDFESNRSDSTGDIYNIVIENSSIECGNYAIPSEGFNPFIYNIWLINNPILKCNQGGIRIKNGNQPFATNCGLNSKRSKFYIYGNANIGGLDLCAPLNNSYINRNTINHPAGIVLTGVIAAHIGGNTISSAVGIDRNGGTAPILCKNRIAGGAPTPSNCTIQEAPTPDFSTTSGPPTSTTTTTTPATAPGAPAIGTATAGDASATVRWSAPSTGGSAITAYVVYEGSGTSNPVSYTGPAARSVVVSGLTNDTAYRFTVRAQNSVGTGSASALSNQVIPTSGAVDTVPDPPTIGTASGGVQSASVTFTPPVDNGGQPVLDYTVTASPGGATKTGTGSPLTVTGLMAGTSYTFTVKARNSVGTGDPSAASNAVTPTAPPPDPLSEFLYRLGYIAGQARPEGDFPDFLHDVQVLIDEYV